MRTYSHLLFEQQHRHPARRAVSAATYPASAFPLVHLACMQADSVRYVMLVSTVEIISASMPTFKALAGPGTLTVVLNNTGNVGW